jgi:hypothetical protein
MRAIQKSTWAAVAFATALAGCATPYDPKADPNRPKPPPFVTKLPAATFHPALEDASLASACRGYWAVRHRGVTTSPLTATQVAAFEATLRAKQADRSCIFWMESELSRHLADHKEALESYDANRPAAQKDGDSNLAAGVLGVAGAVALVGLAVFAAKRGAFSGDRSSSSSEAVDSEWAWDEYRNRSGNLVWACRGVQTGEFAPEIKCAAKIQIDTQWPGKSAP